jgi:hypothetical protein
METNAMKHPNIATIAAILSFSCTVHSPALTTYPDGRPSATLRMEAKDHGVVLKHDGVVYHFYCAVGDEGRVIALATSKDLKYPSKRSNQTH